MPARTNSAMISYNSQLLELKAKLPVSVISPVYVHVAILRLFTDGLSLTAFINRYTISQDEVASG